MRWLLALALALWTMGLGRDVFDRWVDATDLPPLVAETGVEVLDRNGKLLRAYQVGEGRWRLAASPDAVDPAYLAMLIRFEDKRFHDHAGVDPWAMGRAVAQAFRNGRIISGGSTLTMQVARILEDGPTGEWQGKLRQLRVALALERRLTKDEILTLYVNRAPFGGNLEGVRAASLAWFGKPPRRLTPAQSALLVALPQSPERRRPDRAADAATEARDRVLARMQRDGVLTADTVQAAMRLPVPPTRHAFPATAPHLADRALAEQPLAAIHQLTIDRDLQIAMETLATQAVRGRSDRLQIALIAADHMTGEIVASVGSAGYEADGRNGFIDLTQASRSPGSTLKPLIYGLGFDRGLIHPETLIADRPTDFDGYRPQNFDGFFRGELRVRQALQQSLNIPVVAVLQAIGPHHLIAALRSSGSDPQVPGGVPGLAIALGGVGLSLDDMTGLYASIAQGGIAVDLRHRPDPTTGFAPRRVMGDVAAWQVGDILREVPRPSGVQGTGIAFKTGTSYGHRDAWAIGFDGRHVVGVWIGRADGTPVPGVFGGDLAAPVLFDAFARLGQVTPLPSPPPDTLLLPTARLPQPLRQFAPYGAKQTGGPRIAFPPDGALIEGESLSAKVRDGQAPFTWLANGVPVGSGHSREIALQDVGPGFSALTVIDAAGRTARTAFELRPGG
ncbi:MAG: penicillin-binding protein 1C [Paracoccaceae bacterium]